jgi:hypothetical protein
MNLRYDMYNEMQFLFADRAKHTLKISLNSEIWHCAKPAEFSLMMVQLTTETCSIV